MAHFCNQAPKVRLQDGMVRMSVSASRYNGEAEWLGDYVLTRNASTVLIAALMHALNEHSHQAQNIVPFRSQKRSSRRRRATSRKST
jgi:hypothetical protein